MPHTHDGRRTWWLMPLLAIPGALALATLATGKSLPVREPASESARPARVVTVSAVDVIPEAVGFGTVAPARVWEALAQVDGKVVEVHPRLDPGAILPADSVIARIDPADYRLAVAQADADIAAAEAEVADNAVRERNTRDALAIERERLALSERDLERKQALAERGTVARTDLDAQRRETLAQRRGVQSLESTLRQLPVERRLLEARLARQQALRDGARLNLERTEVRLPFDARVAEASVEATQFVRAGQVLAVLDGIERAEVQAEIPVSRMRGLVSTRAGFVFDPTRADLFDELGLTASVTLPEAPRDWPARVDRFSPTIDPRTRTLGVIAAVDEPYRNARPGERPPLVKGMYVEVRIRGATRPGMLVVPREALHAGRLYVSGPGDRLVIRPVRLGLVQPAFAAVESGLEPGERVVISDLVPAIEGMLLAPEEDEVAARQLRAAARGEAR